MMAMVASFYVTVSVTVSHACHTSTVEGGERTSYFTRSKTVVAIADNPNLGDGDCISLIGGGDEQGASFIPKYDSVHK